MTKRLNPVKPETSVEPPRVNLPTLKDQLKTGYQANAAGSREIAQEWLPLEVDETL
jgi:hypothetical protein